MAKKEELVHCLDQHVFNRILQAKSNRLNDHARAALEDVQNRTRAEQERYHHYPSAEKVVEMYKSDLHSTNARKVNATLKRLGLPILADVKEEFERLAGEESRREAA